MSKVRSIRTMGKNYCSQNLKFDARHQPQIKVCLWRNCFKFGLMQYQSHRIRYERQIFYTILFQEISWEFPMSTYFQFVLKILLGHSRSTSVSRLTLNGYTGYTEKW